MMKPTDKLAHKAGKSK